ncbi:hypothetical protein [Fibrella forsythiae]|uniref:Uncharacterized protein n=1 Tax=Fibrella forsythiae TaxID=2817061 RepID=A0ABS3JFV2_9BACT|nr:hypothetical protein [Fibrella forsythiae]MBO0948880.1 hypothetical protein [Fibrella forsythiae]
MEIIDKHRVVLIHSADPLKQPDEFYNSINYVSERYRIFVSDDGQTLEFYLLLKKPYTTDLTRLYKALFGSSPVLKPIPDKYSNFPGNQPLYSDSGSISMRGEITSDKLVEYGFVEDLFRRDRWHYKGVAGWHSPLTKAFYFDQYPQETHSLDALEFIVRLIDRADK